MGMRRVAMIGAGLTKFHRFAQETPKELAFEATKMALDSCEMKLSDVDCVCLGTAPDAQFRQHQWQAEQHDAHHIDQQKRAAPVFSSNIGKSPDVAKTRSTANRCEHKTRTGLPLFPFSRFTHQMLNSCLFGPTVEPLIRTNLLFDGLHYVSLCAAGSV